MMTNSAPTATSSSATIPKNGSVKSLATCHISAFRKMNAENTSRIGSDLASSVIIWPT